jgi:hypothetical protein
MTFFIFLTILFFQISSTSGVPANTLNALLLSRGAQSSSVDSPDERLGWTSSPNQRGTIDIIWSSLATMFLCSWSVLCLNVPSQDDGFFRIIYRRFWLTALCFLGPEFTLQIAFGQYASARQSVSDFAAAGDREWTMAHAFYADMGGFILQTHDNFPAIPINAKQLLWLVQKGIIERPKVDTRAIKDKNKVDGLLRLITLCQVSWFAANTIGRAISGLRITCLELTASAFIICTLATTFLWLHKPADVVWAENIQTNLTMNEIYLKACESMGVNDAYIYCRTPLDIISREEWAWSKYWSNWINILRIMHIRFAPKTMPADRFENTISLPIPLPLYLLCFTITLTYCGVFVSAWNFTFPTVVESYLWRGASLTLLGCAFLYAAITHLILEAYPVLKAKFRANILNLKEESEFQVAHKTWFRQKVHSVAQDIRNNSVGRDPALELPLKAILPVYVLAFIYCCCRTYIFIEDFVELRSLPASVYETVNWSSFLIHLH